MLPGFLENFLESGNLFCIAMAASKTAVGFIQLWFNYFPVILASSLPVKLSRDVLAIGSFTPVSRWCVWESSICQYFGAFPKRHDTCHTRVSRTTRFLSSLIHYQTFRN